MWYVKDRSINGANGILLELKEENDIGLAVVIDGKESEYLKNICEMSGGRIYINNVPHISVNVCGKTLINSKNHLIYGRTLKGIVGNLFNNVFSIDRTGNCVLIEYPIYGADEHDINFNIKHLHHRNSFSDCGKRGYVYSIFKKENITIL